MWIGERIFAAGTDATITEWNTVTGCIVVRRNAPPVGGGAREGERVWVLTFLRAFALHQPCVCMVFFLLLSHARTHTHARARTLALSSVSLPLVRVRTYMCAYVCVCVRACVCVCAAAVRFIRRCCVVHAVLK